MCRVYFNGKFIDIYCLLINKYCYSYLLKKKNKSQSLKSKLFGLALSDPSAAIIILGHGRSLMSKNIVNIFQNYNNHRLFKNI